MGQVLKCVEPLIASCHQCLINANYQILLVPKGCSHVATPAISFVYQKGSYQIGRRRQDPVSEIHFL